MSTAAPSAAEHWDIVVVGSGFGGAMAALALARAGRRVLLLERGGWVDRDASACDARAILVDRKYRAASPYLVERTGLVHPDEAVGGGSIFYGAASLRLREADFAMRTLLSRRNGRGPELVDWPIRYADLEPHYAEAELLLGVAGTGGDPTGPPRSSPYPGAPAPYGRSAQLLALGASRLGLRPFPLPLAINFDGQQGRAACERCSTCDLFPCRRGAKNDMAVAVLPLAQRAGAVVRDRAVAGRLVVERGRVSGVEYLDLRAQRQRLVRCSACVVSAGAIASPLLLLASGLGAAEPHGRLVGRHLMRHCNGIVAGALPQRIDPEREFVKQVAITDYYFGPAGAEPGASPDAWGCIQSGAVPPAVYLSAQAPFLLRRLAPALTPHLLLALCIAHETPNPENRVTVDPVATDPLGLPVARIRHRFGRRDLAARSALYAAGGRILSAAGARLRLRHHIPTFSHALGSCRFGTDPAAAVLDPWCRFFGVPNLFVVDGSFFPTGGAVNPSLTIAANALRVGRHVAEEWDAVARATA